MLYRAETDWAAVEPRGHMPTYITLYNWTEQGVANVEEGPDRLDAADGIAESMGGTLHGFYMTMGAYDLVTVTEFPDDDTVAKFMLKIGGQGNVRTTTMRAWPEADYRELVTNLP